MTDTACLTLAPDLGCVPMQVVGSDHDWGPGLRTVANPVPGAGGTLVFISVAPGPGPDVGGEQWVNPAGATLLDEWESAVASSFEQRVRIWTAPNTGVGSYSFGYQTVATGGLTSQTAAILHVNGTVVAAYSVGPSLGVSTTNSFLPVTTLADYLVLPIVTSQNNDNVTNGENLGPFVRVLDNMATATNRSLAVYQGTATGGPITTPPAVTWDGATAQHALFTVALHCEEPPASTCQPLPRSAFDVYIDPNDPVTYGPNRSDCQLISIGEILNTGVVVGPVHGLGWDAADEIHSFAVDGDTFRHGAVGAPSSLCNTTRVLRSRHAWVNDGSYVFQSGLSNTSVNVPPSDELFFDGTRTQYACIPTSAADPKAVKTSTGDGSADTVVQFSSWLVQPWMLLSDLNVAGGGIHYQGASQSPWTSFVGESELKIITRDSTVPQPSSWSASTRGSVPITAADVGSWWTTIIEYQVDTQVGFLRAWVDKQDGAGFTQFVNVTGGFGLAYAAGDPLNDVAYVMLANFYSWHNDQQRAVNNWEGGQLREMEYAYAGAKINPQLSGLTVAQLMDHAHYFTCESC